jgi:hypothetical protein
MDEVINRAYTIQPGPPQRTVVVAYYERYRKEKGSVPIPQLEATFFAEYLLEHLEEFQAELKLYMSTVATLTDPPKDAI